ncbi:CaiB/BaiF CoA transferase family protein [Variovorax sp. M-6]|uniref:CaiB/BaiF CoA transferase family protein n=1 Tax=Variovorax sp. M-6 TaxID=3233041 RepID=UPI003F9A695C
MNPLILSGVKVLELGQMLAGPYAGAVLADLGADVIKIERPEGGDDARRMGPAFLNDDALAFHVFNRGKRSMALNLAEPAELAVFHGLAQNADILINNLRPGVSEGFGIDGETLCAQHPQLIYCQISAFGHVGPMRMDPGFEPLVQAFSGLSSTNGGPDDPPTRLGASVCDQGTGMWAVIGALALLSQRARTGRGGIVSLSLLETALAWNAQKADGLTNEGSLPPRHRSGHPMLCPYEAFPTKDDPILICCGNDRLFARLAGAVDRDLWIADARYRTNRERLANKEALLAELGQVLAAKPRNEWLETFREAGVPCCEIHAVAQALQHPQVKSLGLMQHVGDTAMVLTGLPLSINGQRPRLQAEAPRLGADNARLAW